MEFTIENYFHFSEPMKWTCMLQKIKEGTVELMVLPIPPSRSRIHLELKDVIYYDAYAGWSGCLMNVATKAELEKFLPNLGSYLLTELPREEIMEKYQLFVFMADGKNKYFVGRDAVIAQVLP